MSGEQHHPTLHDVARAAGVSVSTTSRALGNYGRISQRTRAHIRWIADELGYRPNVIARSMITGKTQSLGVVCADLSSPFFAEALRGVSDLAKERGYSILIVNTDEDLKAEQDAITLLRDKLVDGVIVAPADVQCVEHLARLQRDGRPVVLLDRTSHALEADSVTVDDVAAVARATSHLLDAGHRRIGIVTELRTARESNWLALLTGGVGRTALNPSSRRLLGYIQAHQQHGVEIDPDLVARTGDTTVASALAAAREMIESSSPTAVMSVDNTTSVGAFSAIRELGLSVPADVSFVAFDNLDWTTLVTPPLTVVEQPVYEIGRRAATALTDRLAGERDGAGEEILLETRFVERDSVAAV
ncbi:MAG TPA: LacI family transcriptional regulator [Candidatus Agrococcus pullicola]|uniref:LacI family transcriptional regulator n=1 Tax=Candidatus Agrococcus pullicola TaxID=2838429 RepID=A0A9D1YSQ9_9MICO|nr:LacI family transcriptional regulator [Candidatus Agrococcus pullicola]